MKRINHLKKKKKLISVSGFYLPLLAVFLRGGAPPQRKGIGFDIFLEVFMASFHLTMVRGHREFQISFILAYAVFSKEDFAAFTW